MRIETWHHIINGICRGMRLCQLDGDLDKDLTSQGTGISKKKISCLEAEAGGQRL
jgi:hypothetical protein